MHKAPNLKAQRGHSRASKFMAFSLNPQYLEATTVASFLSWVFVNILACESILCALFSFLCLSLSNVS